MRYVFIEGESRLLNAGGFRGTGRRRGNEPGGQAGGPPGIVPWRLAEADRLKKMGEPRRGESAARGTREREGSGRGAWLGSLTGDDGGLRDYGSFVGRGGARVPVRASIVRGGGAPGRQDRSNRAQQRLRQPSAFVP